jgi:hypothetical protein
MAEVKSDIEIARAAKKKNIMEIGGKLNIPSEHLLPYGHDKAKISADFIAEQRSKPNGKLILVTAINPTPAGEGKTTTTVGLGDGLNRIGKKAIVCTAKPRSVPASASRVALPAAAMPRSCRWRTSTCTSPATSTPSRRRITCSRP